MKKTTLRPLSFLLGATFLFACASVPEFEFRNNESSKIDEPEIEILPDPGREISPPGDEPPPSVIEKPPVVCDPLTDGNISESAQARNGLLGKLSYFLPSEPIAGSVFAFWSLNSITGGLEALRAIEYDLMSSEINVPTRRFDQGFVPMNPDSEPLKTSEGDVLMENFGIYYQSNLVLGVAPVGRYEIATLSDDGSFLKISGALDDESDFIIDNDGVHPTKLKCSSQVIELNEQSELPLELFYHQGPRYHISLILMWRKLNDNEEAGRDPLCGASGNSLFFDFSQSPSLPKPAYLDLLARGWEVIPSTSFLLPNGQINPCID